MGPERSETIEKLAEALALAQAKMAGARKDGANPHLHSRYSSLASIWDACRGPLTEHGLSVVQTTRFGTGGTLSLLTTLFHTSGQWIRGELPILADPKNPQLMGSWITYMRRYALAAIAGIAPEDDDGEAALPPQALQERSRAPDRQSPQRAGNAPRGDRPAPRNPAPPRPETWSQFISYRLRRFHGDWMREMVAEGVEPGVRAEHKELVVEPQVVNHLCTRLIEMERVRPEAVAKEGKPDVRDPARCREVVTMTFEHSPKSTRQAVEKYLDEKREAARVTLGIPGGDLDKEEASAPAEPAEAES